MKLSALLKRIAIAVFALMMIGLIVTACGKEEEQKQEKTEKTVYYDQASNISYNLYI